MRHLLLAVSAINLVIAIIVFIRNRALRDRIGAALGTGIRTPEEEIFRGYDQAHLKSVADRLRAVAAGPNGTLLDLYRRPVLLWNDVTFAVTLSIFSACLWVWVLLQCAPTGPGLVAIMVMAASSLLYAVFDTAEDIVLERAFRTPDAFSRGETKAASVLTRLKALSLAVSIAGGIVFEILRRVVPVTKEPSSPG